MIFVFFCILRTTQVSQILQWPQSNGHSRCYTVTHEKLCRYFINFVKFVSCFQSPSVRKLGGMNIKYINTLQRKEITFEEM